MPDDLNSEIARGKDLAVALVEHLHRMGGAAEATINVIVKDERYRVIVTHQPVEETDGR